MTVYGLSTIFRIRKDIFLHTVNMLILVMTIQYVFCEVEIEFSSVIETNFRIRKVK
jgi:hypothetical protein